MASPIEVDPTNNINDPNCKQHDSVRLLAKMNRTGQQTVQVQYCNILQWAPVPVCNETIMIDITQVCEQLEGK